VADQPVFGLWSMSRDPVAAQLAASCAADYVCVDLQHGFATFADLPGLVQAMRAAGRAPLVRVPDTSDWSIGHALDLGAAGVIVPMVEDPREAARAARACRYPEAGHRSWGPTWGGIVPGADGLLEDQDRRVGCVVQIETPAGAANAGAIASVPGVDAVYIGPNDLALTCGFGRVTGDRRPAFERLLAQIVDACLEAGTVVGLHCTGRPMADRWVGRGVRMATLGHDTSILSAALARTFG
jgi:4-hydroxy-2-oxoheptanedioate aldolase